jgi:hypothetical protein
VLYGAHSSWKGAGDVKVRVVAQAAQRTRQFQVAIGPPPLVPCGSRKETRRLRGASTLRCVAVPLEHTVRGRQEPPGVMVQAGYEPTTSSHSPFGAVHDAGGRGHLALTVTHSPTSTHRLALHAMSQHNVPTTPTAHQAPCSQLVKHARQLDSSVNREHSSLPRA